MNMFEDDSGIPTQVSPELVLVSPPDVARAAREALEPRSRPPRVEPPAEPKPDPPVAQAPVPPARRSRPRVLLAAAALVLVGGGFLAGRQLSGQRRAPTASPAASQTEERAGAPTTVRSVRTAKRRAALTRLPLVTWRPKPGVRRYRFDLLSGRVAILTIMTDEPRAQIPLTWPNAGHRRHLAPGRYRWTVRAATDGRGALIARGTVTIRRPHRS